jgi:hypothetical protein
MPSVLHELADNHEAPEPNDSVREDAVQESEQPTAPAEKPNRRDDSPEGIIRRQKFAIELLTSHNAIKQGEITKLRDEVQKVKLESFSQQAVVDGFS